MHRPNYNPLCSTPRQKRIWKSFEGSDDFSSVWALKGVFCYFVFDDFFFVIKTFDL